MGHRTKEGQGYDKSVIEMKNILKLGIKKNFKKLKFNAAMFVTDENLLYVW